MKIKTSELTGPALDWAVAKCEGNEITIRKGYLWIPTECYSTDWSQGGPIIEREGINLRRSFDEDGWTASVWRNNTTIFEHGETALIAALRCYVASKLGDEVEIPEELK